jgi:pimeloyl-ACP methyl ester carboxylesterase
MFDTATTEFARVGVDVHEGPRKLRIAGLSNSWVQGRPTVIWLHANGFNARSYLQTLEPLADHLNILAIDQRGHGATPQNASASNKTDALDLRDDLIALLDVVCPDDRVILSGHSLGGCVSLLAAAEVPDRVGALALFDPVVLSRDAARKATDGGGAALSENTLVAKARNRRARFASRQEAFEVYRQRSIFQGWPRLALRDYIEAGFRDLPDGSVELACAPEWEAANFAAHGHDIWAAMAKIEAPVAIYRAEQDSTCAIALASEFPHPTGQATVRTVPGSTHFLPIEAPQVVREALLEVAEVTPA